MRMTLALRHMLDTIGVPAAASDVEIHLIKEPFSPTPSAVVADFTEADYTGYAAVNVTPTAGVAWDDEAGNAVLSFVSAHFQPTGSAITNTIFGYYVVTSVVTPAAPELVDVFQFNPPIALLGPSDAIDVIYLMKIGPPVE